MQAACYRVIAGGLVVFAIALSRTTLAADGQTPGVDVLARAFGGEAEAIALDDEALKSRSPGVSVRRNGDGRLGIIHVLDSALEQFGGPSLRVVTSPGNASPSANRAPLTPFGLPALFAPPGLR